jgi:hypothetical protein
MQAGEQGTFELKLLVIGIDKARLRTYKESSFAYFLARKNLVFEN